MTNERYPVASRQQRRAAARADAKRANGPWQSMIRVELIPAARIQRLKAAVRQGAACGIPAAEALEAEWAEQENPPTRSWKNETYAAIVSPDEGYTDILVLRCDGRAAAEWQDDLPRIMADIAREPCLFRQVPEAESGLSSPASEIHLRAWPMHGGAPL